ncbi:MAG: hypothetical protein Q9225_003256 [Loekoesia sp. 1 TL-2023]
MDYLSLKFLNRGPDLGRNSDERLRPLAFPCSNITVSHNTHTTFSRQKPPPQSPHGVPSPTSIKTSNSTSSHQPSPRFALPNDDTLPSSFAALEGHLNHHASQLQQLADRVESINEWIELDNIVLARLIRDEEKRVEDLIAAERNNANDATTNERKGVHFALGPTPSTTTSTTPLVPPADKIGKRSASMGDVPRSPSLGSRKSDLERKEEAVESHSGIREVRDRIRAMKRWRKELEKAVFWQREEYWRVESKMGKQKKRESVASSNGEVDEVGKEDKTGQGVGKVENRLSVVGGGKWEDGKREKWSRDSAGGRLPTQREWEALFSYSG